MFSRVLFPPKAFRVRSRINFWVGLTVLLLLSGTLQTSLPAQAPEADKTDASQLVLDLSGSDFDRRESSSRKLIALGKDAIPALEAAMSRRDHEVINRCAHILGAISLSNDTNEQLALESLFRVRENGIPVAAAAAESQLREVRRVLEQNAVTKLRGYGAHIDKVYDIFSDETRYHVYLGSNFRATPEQFFQIARISGVAQVRFDGEWATNEYLPPLVYLSDLRTLSFYKCKITGEGAKQLGKLPRLQLLEIRYCPLGDDAIPELTQLGFLLRLTLYGTDISPEGAERLVDNFGKDTVDYRSGGFLGLLFDRLGQSCAIERVVRDSAAQQAGIQAGNVILAINGKAVITSEEAIAEISKCKVSQEVTLSIEQNGIVNELRVKLGEWPERNENQP